MRCSLCLTESASVDLNRLSGIDLCAVCHATDPAHALTELGFAVEWNVAIGKFSAGIGIPRALPDFYLSCAPELLHHKVMKLVVHEVQVGDAVFDSKIYVRTSDPERAAEVLSSDGVQSALLGLLTGMRANDLRANHVTLDGSSLTIGVVPIDGLSDERVATLKLEAAALALHLWWRRPASSAERRY